MIAGRHATALCVVLAIATRSLAQQTGPSITGDTVAAIRDWVAAVKSHDRGHSDAALEYVSGLSYEAREELNAGMDLYLRALLMFPYTTRGMAATEIVAIAHSAGVPDAAAFLKRAAILHADVASQIDRVSSSPQTARAPMRKVEDIRIGGGMGRTRIESTPYVPPLLISDQIVLNQDGQAAGHTVASWNWPFARSLLDLLALDRSDKLFSSETRPKPARDPFVSIWYHATSAQMFAAGAYGDLTPHLIHAAMILPDDARLLFDRGCYAELLGLPLQQSLANSLGMNDARAQLIRPDAPGAWTTGQRPPPAIPPPAKTNADAERLFRQALSADPSLTEARVRLARLLGLRGRHDEALRAANAAVDATPPTAVAYLAHLFAGRAAQALGNLDEAAGHYGHARQLYPHAQSALLASSQLALLGSDIESAISMLSQLRDRSAASDEDPWWGYQLCAGRDASELRRAMWDVAPR